MTSRLPKHLYDALMGARRAGEFLGELDVEPALRQRMPELELAIGLRNRLIHGYDRVLHGVVVGTVQRDLPHLQASLEVELKRFPLG